MTSSGEYFRVGPMRRRRRELEKPLTLPLLLSPLLHSTTSSSDCSHFIHCAHIVLLASYKDVYAL